MSEILDRTLPDWKDAGWIYNVFYGSPYLCLGDDVSIDILLDATASAIQIFRAENSELYVFHDGFAAGWRITSKRIRSFQFSTQMRSGK